MTKKDAEEYFENINNLKAGASIIDVLLERRAKEHSNTNTILNEKATLDFWLKPSDDMKANCGFVDLNGNINFSSIENYKGVRPAIWVSLE